MRVALTEPREAYAEGILNELRKEADVLGTTHGVEGGPADPGLFDVVLAMDYDPATVIEALVGPEQVAAATAVPVEVVAEDADQGADASDVSAAVESIETEDAAGGDPDDSDALEGPSADEEASDGEPSPEPAAESDAQHAAGTVGPRGASAKAADAPGAGPGDLDGESSSDSPNHPAFEEFKSVVDPVPYDNLIEELESTSLPGDFQDSADLSPVLEDAEADGDADGSAAGRTAAGDGGSTGSTASSRGVDGDVDVPQVQGTEVSPDAVVNALVTALEQDALTDDQRRTINDALHGGPPKTMAVKLDHLQREIDELTAYKDSLETFIDNYGSGDELVDEIREAMQAFASDVQRIGETVQALRDVVEQANGLLEQHEGRLADHDDRLDATEDGLASARERLSETGGRVDDLAERVDRTDGRVDAHEDRLDYLSELEPRVSALEGMDEELEELATEIEVLREEVADGSGAGTEVADRLASIEESIGGLETRMSALESETSASVDAVAERLEDVEQRLETHDAWRDQFQSLLAASNTPEEDDLP